MREMVQNTSAGSNDEELVRQHTVVSDDGGKITVSFPGIDLEDFHHRFGYINLWNILKYFSMSRTLSYLRKDFFVSTLMEEGHSLFVVQVDIFIDRKFYDVTSRTRMWSALEMTTELDSIGRSSLKTRGTLRTKSRDQVGIQGQPQIEEPALVTGIFSLVRVNLATRRSSLLSESFLRKFGATVSPSTGAKDTTTSSQRSGTETSVFEGHETLEEHQLAINDDISTFVVLPCDVDYNKHMTNFAYARYCFSVASLHFAQQTKRQESASSEYFDSGEILARRVKSTRIKYIRESRAGDVVKVEIFADQEHTDWLHFRLVRLSRASAADDSRDTSKTDSPEILYSMSVEFYDDDVTERTLTSKL